MSTFCTFVADTVALAPVSNSSGSEEICEVNLQDNELFGALKSLCNWKSYSEENENWKGRTLTGGASTLRERPRKVYNDAHFVFFLLQYECNS